MISIVVPTVHGREGSLERCLAAYRETTPEPFELIVIKDAPACGVAWQEGAARAEGDYLHFTADDLVPAAGWAEAATACVEAGRMPAATVLNDGVVLQCPVYLEPRYRDTQNVLVPFLSRGWYEEGGWLVPIHYGSDDWVTYLACERGIPVEMLPGYRFDHFAAEAGRLWLNRALDVPKLATLMEKAGFCPPIYGRLASDYGWAGWTG